MFEATVCEVWTSCGYNCGGGCSGGRQAIARAQIEWRHHCCACHHAEVVSNSILGATNFPLERMPARSCSAQTRCLLHRYCRTPPNLLYLPTTLRSSYPLFPLLQPTRIFSTAPHYRPHSVTRPVPCPPMMTPAACLCSCCCRVLLQWSLRSHATARTAGLGW
jgi:hypothetical protein